jgi:hypothetical protein
MQELGCKVGPVGPCEGVKLGMDLKLDFRGDDSDADHALEPRLVPRRTLLLRRARICFALA